MVEILAKMKKARGTLDPIWSKGERELKNNIKRRMHLFDALVKRILLYEVEI